MLKKDLPGKDWLVHTLPGLYPAARASLLDKKLTAASYNRLKCFLCTGHHGVEQQRGEQPAWFWHTESPSHAQPSSPPGMGTAEILRLQARASFLLHLVYIWHREGVRSHDSARKSLYLFCLEERGVQ